MSKLVLPLHRVLGTSISCHSEHREESQFAFHYRDVSLRSTRHFEKLTSDYWIFQNEVEL